MDELFYALEMLICTKSISDSILCCSHSHMSYMELKRRHENLASEVQTLEQKSREAKGHHQLELHRLAEEIRHYKVGLDPLWLLNLGVGWWCIASSPGSPLEKSFREGLGSGGAVVV